MKRFVWRLQRVLDIKIKEEQAKKAELIALTEKLTQARSELLVQKRVLAGLLDDLSKRDARERLGRQELFMQYSARHDELIKQLEAKVRTIEVERKERIAEVVKLSRFREGLEKLREKAKTEFMKRQEKLEQKEFDERSTVRFARETARR